MEQAKEYRYFDNLLKKNLEPLKTQIKKDWDFCFVIDGLERSGKSVLAQKVAAFLDPTFKDTGIDRICFTSEELENAINKSKKYQAVIFDEAFTGLSSRNAMTGVNKKLIELFAEVGQKNLFLIIVMPNFFDLEKYIAVHRSIAFIHVYTKGFERGYFRFYNAKKKKLLYILGKKTYNHNAVLSNFYGKFGPGYVVDEEAYRDKKAQSLVNKKEKAKTEEVIGLRERKYRDGILKIIEKFNLTQKDVAETVGISRQIISEWKKSAAAAPSGDSTSQVVGNEYTNRENAQKKGVETE